MHVNDSRRRAGVRAGKKKRPSRACVPDFFSRTLFVDGKRPVSSCVRSETEAKPRKGGDARKMLSALGGLFDALLVLVFAISTVIGTMGGCSMTFDGWDRDIESPEVEWSSIGGADHLEVMRGVSPVQDVVVHFSEPMDRGTLKPENIYLVRAACISSSYCISDENCGRAFEEEMVACLENRCRRAYTESKFLAKLVQTWHEDRKKAENRPPWDVGGWREEESDPVLRVCSPEHEVVWGDVVISDDGRQVHLRMRKPLEPNNLYTLIVSADVTDRAGNPLMDPSTGETSHKRSFVTSNPFSSCTRLRLMNPPPGFQDTPRNIPGIWLNAEPGLSAEALSSLDLVRGDPYSPFDFLKRSCVPQHMWRRKESEFSTLPACPRYLGKGVNVEGAHDVGYLPVSHACSSVDGQGCYYWPLGGLLEPNTRYSLHLDSDRIMGPGCMRFDPSIQSFFSTGSTADNTPPGMTLTFKEMMGGCMAAGITATEPVMLGVSVSCDNPDKSHGYWSVPDYKYLHRFSVPIHDVCKGAPARVELSGVDLAGNRTLMQLDEIVEYRPVPAVIITEVLANPAGAEPRQEFVEILNIGDTLVKMEGWRLSDRADADGDLVPTETLFPGEFGLLVAPNYDPYCDRDPNPDPNALIIYMPSTLGTRGLVNRGSPVYLRDSNGELISALLESPDMSSASDDGRSLELTAPVACSMDVGWEKNPHKSSTPGLPNSGW